MSTLTDSRAYSDQVQVLIYYIVVGIYNVYFHPLRHIPGPKAAAAGRFVWALHQRNGTLVHYVTALHNRYGEVVRLAPNEISFISGETAWRDIYTARAVKRNSNPGAYLKDPNWYARTPNGVSSISTASEVDHARQRRLLSHAFSEKALKSQEPIIQSQVDLLIRRLHEHVHDQAKGIVDLVRWYSFTTFDVIADLTFGESFHCLRDRKFHPWAAMAYEALKSNGFISMKQYFPIWARIVFFFKKQKQLESRAEFFRFVENRVAWRMSTETSRQDFMGHILRHQDEKGMTVKEIQSSMTSFMVAGSETTATCLSGATIMLLQHPDKLTTLTDEIRSKFSKNADITIDEVSKLPFLDAVVHEALRVYAPSPTGFPRVVPAGGDIISGHWIPEKVRSTSTIDPHQTNFLLLG